MQKKYTKYIQEYLQRAKSKSQSTEGEIKGVVNSDLESWKIEAAGSEIVLQLVSRFFWVIE